MFAAKDTLLTRPSGGAYQISRSVRLRSSASAYLNRTLTAPTNNKIFTISAWVKRGLLSTSANHQILSGYVPATSFDGFFIGGSASTYTDKLVYFDNTTGYLVSTQVFRDPSAWYHVMAAIDTTQATASNRVKLYVNGTQITSFSTTNYPSLNQAVIFNSAVAHTLGSFGYNSTAYYDGYLTEFNFIDGQQLTPTSFGETNAVTGVWQPKEYAGTYGTNGFYLNFSDPTSTTTIGNDYSGNGNNWTSNNISVTSGSTYDSMVDSPTVSAVSSNYAVWNPLVPTGQAAPTDGNLSQINSTGCRTATIPFPQSGKWYLEWLAGSNTMAIVVGLPFVPTTQANSQTYSVGYYNNGNKYIAGTATSYGATFTSGDIIGLALDFTVNPPTITFYKNNSSQGAINLTSGIDYVVAAGIGGTGLEVINFGQRPFSYTPPTGFVALNTYNLPASTIKNGAAYMAATLYTGTGASLTVANTVGSASFQPDFVWVKGRSGATDHALYDSVRGVQLQLESNTTTDETTETTGLTAFGSTGFTVGALAQMNTSAATYVAWQWKEGATQGFDIVTYTGSGSARTISHNLGVVPNMIIVKARTTASTDQGWPVYHSANTAAPETDYLLLNSTAATADLDTVWNDTAPTSSVFSVGTNANVNANNDTYVAYCFAAVAGYSAFGSYTGNGSADGPFVFLNFRPRFILIKQSSAAGENWEMWDSSRGAYNINTPLLYANLSNAETAGNAARFDALSNGFKVRSTNAGVNASGGTYVYMAFAENPFKNSLAR